MKRLSGFFLFLLFGFLIGGSFYLLSRPNLEKASAGLFLSEELRLFSYSFESQWRQYKEKLEFSMLRSDPSGLDEEFPALVWMQRGQEKPRLFKALRREEALALRAPEDEGFMRRLPGGRTLLIFTLLGSDELPVTRVAIDPAQWFRGFLSLKDPDRVIQRYILDSQCRIAFHTDDQMIGKDLSSLKVCFLKKTVAEASADVLSPTKEKVESYLNFSGDRVLGGIRPLDFSPGELRAFSVYEVGGPAELFQASALARQVLWWPWLVVLVFLAAVFSMMAFRKKSPSLKKAESPNSAMRPAMAIKKDSKKDSVDYEKWRDFADSVQNSESPLSLVRHWITQLKIELEGYEIEFFKYLSSSAELKSIEENGEIFRLKEGDRVEDLFSKYKDGHAKIIAKSVRSGNHLFGVFVFRAQKANANFKENTYQFLELIALPKLEWLFENIKGRRRQTKVKNGPSQSV